MDNLTNDKLNIIKDNHRLNSDGTAITMMMIIPFIFLLFFATPSNDGGGVLEYEIFKLFCFTAVTGAMVTNIYNVRYYKSKQMLKVLLSIATLSFIIMSLIFLTHFMQNSIYVYVAGAFALIASICIILLLKYIKKSMQEFYTDKKDLKTSVKVLLTMVVFVLFGVALFIGHVNYIATVIIFVLGITAVMGSLAYIFKTDGIMFYNKPSWYILFAVCLIISMTLLHTLERSIVPIIFNLSLLFCITMPYSEICVRNYSPDWQSKSPLMIKLAEISKEEANIQANTQVSEQAYFDGRDDHDNECFSDVDYDKDINYIFGIDEDDFDAEFLDKVNNDDNIDIDIDDNIDDLDSSEDKTL